MICSETRSFKTGRGISDSKTLPLPRPSTRTHLPYGVHNVQPNVNAGDHFLKRAPFDRISAAIRAVTAPRFLCPACCSPSQAEYWIEFLHPNVRRPPGHVHHRTDIPFWNDLQGVPDARRIAKEKARESQILRVKSSQYIALPPFPCSSRRKSLAKTPAASALQSF